ncbi:monovalent cation/H+ antiporter subunit D family protein [Aurantimonas aggregata]|uniref:Monovalent cation/H+ antiporter subunit D family protein n=1 Tax=Aurantimonas aggregata TaxID=2047720 RepID=A0A6L9MNV6_9HYPH|nr:proton-conducting transporter membrane subunit [Aurantimonas aggregata]NDV89481.1 monovalent cation/H+ antiporter subunit D family protein [Aurantimonas aggregata]
MSALLPVLILLASLVPAGLTFFVPDHRRVLRNTLSLGGAVLKLGLVAFMLFEVADGTVYESRLEFAPGLYLLLRVDALALLFVSLSAVLWFLTTIYAIAYFGKKPELSRFFGFFSLCVAATTGLALSGTLISFFIFYELLTLSTWPLLVHKRDGKSLAAGRAYLAYALPAGAVLLAAIVWLESVVGPVEFTVPPDLDRLDDISLRIIFAMFVVGFGVKAALIPLHGWLPKAMVAPAPVSALLHAVAVVKAGAFGILRLVFDVFGLDRVAALGLGTQLAVLASATILWGSLQALRQTEIKKRLAYSTVSQVSYIVLGVALGGPYAVTGGVVHLVHQGLMKITLFFCAGIFDQQAGVSRIDALNGIGVRMPWTAACFTIGAMGMVGLPPTAGFVTKFYLGVGALQSGAPWAVGVLVASTLLNAAYFLPLVYRMWFIDAPPEERPVEAPALLIGPAVVTALASLAVGVLAGAAISPLGWATLIVEREYLP